MSEIVRIYRYKDIPSPLKTILSSVVDRLDGAEGQRGSVKQQSDIDLNGHGIISSDQIPVGNDFDMQEHRIINCSEGTVPTGTILIWAGGGILPIGFLTCDGAFYNADSYPDLFNIIGYTYGKNNLDQFAVPDLQSKFVIGASSSYTIRSTGGEETHTHDTHPAKTTGAADVGATAYGTTASTVTLKAHTHTITAETHSTENHVPPYMALDFIIRT